MLILKAREVLPFEAVFRRWKGQLPKRGFPSQVDSDGYPEEGSVKIPNDYMAVWNKARDANLLPQGERMDGNDVILTGVAGEVKDTSANLKENIILLRDILKDADGSVTVGSREITIDELAHGMTRWLKQPIKSKPRDYSYLKRKLQSRRRFLQDFKINLSPPTMELEEGDFPYKEKMATLIYDIKRSDISEELEKIFVSENGDYNAPNGQRAFKFNFDAEIEEGKPRFPKLQRMFNAVQKLLTAKVDYYTLDLEQKTGPLFEALVYVFNEVGEGSQKERFFSSEIRSAAQKKITSAKRKDRGRLHGFRSKNYTKIAQKYGRILRDYTKDQTILLNDSAKENIASLNATAKDALQKNPEDRDEIKRILRNGIAKINRELSIDLKNIPLNLKRLKDEYDSKIKGLSPLTFEEIQAKTKEVEDEPIEGERAKEFADWFEAEARRLGILAPGDEEE